MDGRIEEKRCDKCRRKEEGRHRRDLKDVERRWMDIRRRRTRKVESINEQGLGLER